MFRLTSRSAPVSLLVLLLAIAVAAPAANVFRLATAVVPGTGLKITEMGDDFEDSTWKWHPNGPKSSRNLDRRERLPGGVSENELWYESTYRGRPDLVRQVGTPLGGAVGSKASMLIRTLHRRKCACGAKILNTCFDIFQTLAFEQKNIKCFS